MFSRGVVPNEFFVLLDRRQIPDRGVKTLAITPSHPLRRSELHLLPIGPSRRLIIDDFRLKQPDRRLHQPIVIRVAHGPDRAFHRMGFQQGLQIRRGVLRSRIRMMNHPSRREPRIVPFPQC